MKWVKGRIRSHSSLSLISRHSQSTSDPGSRIQPASLRSTSYVTVSLYVQCSMHICIPVCICTYSSAIQEQKSHTNKTKCKKLMLFLDQNFLFFRVVHIFWCKSNVMYRKMDKTIYRNSACIQSAFSAYRTQLTGKHKCTIRKSRKCWCRNNITILNLLSNCT